MVIPNFVKQALAGRPMTVFGDGKQSRCFTDVADVVRALIALAEHSGAVGEVFNVGGDSEITILELAEKVKKLTGSASEIVFIPYDKAYEEGFEDMQRRVPDITKVRQLIGYEPTLTLDQTLGRVIDYFSKT
jgi:UDP-glucose 4-epimerase